MEIALLWCFVFYYCFLLKLEVTQCLAVGLASLGGQ